MKELWWKPKLEDVNANMETPPDVSSCPSSLSVEKDGHSHLGRAKFFDEGSFVNIVQEFVACCRVRDLGATPPPQVFLGRTRSGTCLT